MEQARPRIPKRETIAEVLSYFLRVSYNTMATVELRIMNHTNRFAIH